MKSLFETEIFMSSKACCYCTNFGESCESCKSNPSTIPDDPFPGGSDSGAF